MNISELSQLSGVPAKTIRYYEESGVIPQSRRRPNGYRSYQKSDVERLIFVRRCRELRIPLAQIKLMLRLQDQPSATPCSDIDSIIEEQANRVRETICELKQLENQLDKLRASCTKKNIEGCGILSNLHNHGLSDSVKI